MKYTRKEIIKISIAVSWGLLGFKRGIDDYKYSLENMNKLGDKKLYLYTNAIYSGFLGSFIYICPPTFFIVANKEIYRLEVNLRNLESEKNTSKYKYLM